MWALFDFHVDFDDDDEDERRQWDIWDFSHPYKSSILSVILLIYYSLSMSLYLSFFSLLVSFYLFLSVSLYLFLSLCFSFYLFLSLSFYLIPFSTVWPDLAKFRHFNTM